jgi:hypothetical protein
MDASSLCTVSIAIYYGLMCNYCDNTVADDGYSQVPFEDSDEYGFKPETSLSKSASRLSSSNEVRSPLIAA